ncbi:unnamed protein product [Phaedon cochleariae]|uniref:XPG N-terminal domain-containing protein n=1 Tax=Phaedon cochleariae TaxID=80249 RepID=A0A9P0DVH4_PHACE|nr:unnamed protein product [Phaedon cochleariae]
MGIKGLTTFVRNKSQYCMESYELHDTNLVIDGDAVLCQLYLKHTLHRNACFGGDYDKFGNTIYKFFQMLSECKITPYVILDGGYESRKMDTILERFKMRLQNVEILNPRTQGKSPSTPLFIRETFEDIALKLGIKLVRCDFEGDRETASIAKAINCPVMSNDSDFFIFGIPYIPFLSLKMNVVSGGPFKYIECEIFSADKFVECIGGLDRESLPLLSTIIGNDFSNGVDLSKLGLNEDNSNGSGMLHRIEVLISWLQRESHTSAMDKILKAYEEPEREHIRKEMENAVNGYTLVDSQYLKYLREDLVKTLDITSNLKNQDDFEYNTYEKLVPAFPKAFIENFRKSLYPTRFLDILTQNKYYNFKPQIEISNMDHTHTGSLDIMSAVHKILTSSSNNLVCLVRIKKDVGEIIVPACDLDIPSFADIQDMDLQTRKKLLLKILDIDASFVMDDLKYYPKSWYLFMFTLTYMIKRSSISWPLVYSAIICKIAISYLDPQIGFFRTITDFDKQFYQQISHKLDNYRRRTRPLKNRLQEAFSDITYDDALLAMSQLIPYFEMDPQLYNNQSFQRLIVHHMGEFQSVLLHVKCLNQLLNMPFEDFLISDCFNGTFIYNFTKGLREQYDLDDYMKYGLRHSPIVCNCFELVVDTLKKNTSVHLEKRRKF